LPESSARRKRIIGAVTLARRLSRFADRLRFDDLPPEVVASVRLRALDILGIALAASTSEVAPSVLGALQGWGQGGACSVVGSSLTAAPPLAALANGALAHGLDFDDTHAASITHASAVVLPTVFALGEAGGYDGRAVVTAAVAGYEAIARLGMAAPGAFHAGGWHATAVCGTFAATLAAGRLEGLDEERLTAALGIAGSFASGVIEHLEDGSWVKRVHPGWAAHSGIVAAGLARGGFTGPATILEGRFGFYRTFLRAAPAIEPFETLGKRWETLQVGFKPYPCCHYNHAYLDCALQLREQHRLQPDSIERVECRVPAGEIPIVCEPRDAKLRPRTPYDAQFSLAFSVAAALIDGRVDLDTYTKDRIGDERVLALASRVDHALDPASTFPNGFPGWVRVRLRDGQVLEAREPAGRGGPARPLEPGALVAKFRSNAGRALPAARVEAVERLALSLDSLADVSALMRACRA
jgi:2-methylcitrate dehydratase PrpD